MHQVWVHYHQGVIIDTIAVLKTWHFCIFYGKCCIGKQEIADEMMHIK